MFSVNNPEAVGENPSFLNDTTEIDDPQTPDCNFKSPSPLFSKISKKIKSNDKVEVIENKMDEAFTILKQITQTPAKNKCTLFTDLLCVKLEPLNKHKQVIAMKEIDNLKFRLKHSDNRMVQPQPSHYQFQSTNIPTYSQQLHHDYSTASASSSLQPLPSPDYISSTPSTYYHQHYQQLQKPTPTTLQQSNVGEKSFDQDTNFGSSY
ncbi:uncharacterized protein LOC132948164 [Metopolophium dirhodum]|uniref:uncharacterized protein LOC132948164 n=1 Tax=Metopolophium dirhodum TaxID=44670 RepID=UPI0029904098|nr:uncharacterized protein LOC132948164 [Metopolophium dirhodum]